MCSVIIEPDNFNIQYLYFLQKVKNNVKQNSFFSRLIYSNEYFSLKNMYIPITLKNISYKDQYLKTNILFTEKDNILEPLYNIEKQILQKFVENLDEDLVPIYCIFNQCKLNYIKIFKNNLNCHNNNEIVIYTKISGIWQTGHNIGLTYKFI